MRSRMIRALSFLTACLCSSISRGDEPLVGLPLTRFYDTSLAWDGAADVSGVPAPPARIAICAATDIEHKDQSKSNQSSGDPATGLSPTESNNGDCGGNPDTCHGAPLCCHLCPCTYAWAEGLVWWRDNQASGRPLVRNLNSGDTLIGTGDIDFGAAGGVRVGYGVRTCCNEAWEFEYLGLFDQSGSESVSLANQLALPGDLGLAVNNFFFADHVAVRYESDLNNVEVNHVCCCCGGCCSTEWLYGFRYLNLHETLAIVSTDIQESTSTYRVHTDNNLFGMQLGRRYRECCGCWSWEATGKAGIFGNAAEQSSDPIIDFPNFRFRDGRSASEGDVAFVGDLNFTGVYQLNSVWGLRAGYNLMWIEGVALAPDQLDFTNSPDSGTRLSTSGGVFLHGVNVGLEARW